MGKFERGEAEELEIGLVELLNQGRTSRRHKCLNNLFKTIIASYPNINKALFVGRSYDEPGNIKLILGNGKVVYLELKLVESGKGTRANISQDALTSLGLLYDPSGKTVSWSKFREQNSFDKKVLSELRRFTAYPKNISRDKKEDMAKYLRDYYIKPKPGQAIETKAKEILRKASNQDERLAAEIVLNILELARKDKLEYINYLRGLHQDPDKIRKFTILLLLGFHKMETLERGFQRFNQVINALARGEYNFTSYYVIKENCSIHKEDLSCLIPKLLQANFRISFPQDQTNVVIEFRDPTSGSYAQILRVVFHWKNIFQGIKTPCLNVFDEGILKEYYSCSQPLSSGV